MFSNWGIATGYRGILDAMATFAADEHPIDVEVGNNLVD